MWSEDGAQGDKKRRKVLLPSQQPEGQPVPGSVHGSAPGGSGEDTEGSQKESVPSGPQKNYSTGFILGVLMLAIALAGGIAIARLCRRVERLESRVTTLENVQAASPFTGGGLDSPRLPASSR
jgi:hypothetical protein